MRQSYWYEGRAAGACFGGSLDDCFQFIICNLRNDWRD